MSFKCKGVSLSTTVRLLSCHLEIMSSNLRNNRSICKIRLHSSWESHALDHLFFTRNDAFPKIFIHRLQEQAIWFTKIYSINIPCLIH